MKKKKQIEKVCFVVRIPKRLKEELDEVLRDYTKETFLRITATSFLISALEFKLKEFKNDKR